MALPTSGALSFANLQTEFGGSHPITMGEYAAFRMSGSGNTISMNQFYGASSSETQTVTVGTFYDGGAYIPSTSYGYGQSQSYGSVSDGTLGVVGNANILVLGHNNLVPNIILTVSGTVANSGFTTMTVAGTAYSRSAASFFQNTVAGTPFTTAWTWATTTNPFGTTVGATKAVVFT